MRKIKKFFSVAAALLFTVYPLSGFSAAGRHEIEIKACMECHGEDGMEMTFGDKTSLSLKIDLEKYGASVHGKDITCVDCHKGYTSEHEQGKKFASRMEYTRINYEICKKCHFSTYTKTLEGVHYHLMEQGNQNVPLCVDCHGYHYVLKPAKPRSKISAACGKCHSAIYEIYRNSIHGNALYEESNVDVPVCTDCHKSHGIEDPRTMKFHLRSPEICAKCHSNEEMMGKYGISTDVMDTYLRDFHGTTASLYQKEGNSDISFIAVCSDCHGIHDIKKVDDTHSSVYEANLLNVCKKCHEKATTNFTAAWLSHYEPSPSKAPLVYYVKLFYRIFIPFVILGLLIHVFLHLYRRMVKR